MRHPGEAWKRACSPPEVQGYPAPLVHEATSLGRLAGSSAKDGCASRPVLRE